jgi:hypothetical protein
MKGPVAVPPEAYRPAQCHRDKIDLHPFRAVSVVATDVVNHWYDEHKQFTQISELAPEQVIDRSYPRCAQISHRDSASDEDGALPEVSPEGNET